MPGLEWNNDHWEPNYYAKDQVEVKRWIERYGDKYRPLYALGQIVSFKCGTLGIISGDIRSVNLAYDKFYLPTLYYYISGNGHIRIVDQSEIIG